MKGYSSVFMKGAQCAFLLFIFLISSFCFGAEPPSKKPAHHSHYFAYSKKEILKTSAHPHYAAVSCPNTNTVHHHFSSNQSWAIADSIDMKHTTAYQDSVFSNAIAQIGKPYIWGGESSFLGFDCSGLSQYVYKKQGIQIPRTALAQYNTLIPVKVPSLGDLVFFRTHGQKVSHVGIYLGDGYFIHSPTSGESIRIDTLASGYWKNHYAGARRAIPGTLE